MEDLGVGFLSSRANASGAVDRTRPAHEVETGGPSAIIRVDCGMQDR
jgi:hypothetical protein